MSENLVIGITYTLTDPKTSEKLDSNVGGAPLEFISGKNQIIPGLEKEVVGMAIDESKDVLVKPEEAYGEHNPEATQTLPIEQFTGIELKEGMTLYGQGEQNETVQVIVKSFDEKEVVIDFNHPLAGKELMFSVQVVSSREATAEEVMTGNVGGQADSCCGGGGHHHDDEGHCGTNGGAGCGCH